jgi:hypothetical protein
MKTNKILLMLSIFVAIVFHNHSRAQQTAKAEELVTFQAGQTLAKLKEYQLGKKIRIGSAMLMALKMKATNDVIIVLERDKILYLMEYIKQTTLYSQLTVWRNDKYFSFSDMDTLKPLGLPIVSGEEAERDLIQMEEKKTGQKIVPKRSP